MGIRRPNNKVKNPAIFSHEFVIQNHADIVSCVAMVFVIGLMFQATNPIASLFVTMQHTVNNTVNGTEEVMPTQYTYGMKDICASFFYLLICIVIHAVIQEYVLDKLNRRMHLSKVKHSKFNESGQLLTFYAISAVWGIDIMVRENYLTNISKLWTDYPHAHLPFILKFFFIIQMAYWVHCLPELYFQKIKKDEMASRIQYAVLYFTFITSAYVLNFSRVALCMLVFHYMVEMVFHLSRLLYFSEKTELSTSGFMVWNVLFVLIRLGTITLAVLTFWYGLAQTSQSLINIADGNFNTQIVRINCLVAACLLQAWMMWNFITFHLKRMRERGQTASTGKRFVSSAAAGAMKRKEKKSRKGDDDYIPDGAVIENGSTRQRSTKAKK